MSPRWVRRHLHMFTHGVRFRLTRGSCATMTEGLSIKLPPGHGMRTGPGDREGTMRATVEGMPTGVAAIGDRITVTDDEGTLGVCIVVAVTTNTDGDRVTLGALL